MASQTIGPIYAIEDQANTVCKAYSLADGSLVGSSATLSAPGASGIDYFPVFTDLPAAEYRFVLESSAGAALAYGFAAVTLTTATFSVYGQPATDRLVDLIDEPNATALDAISDAVLTRNVSNVEASVDEHTLATMILGALEWSISGSVLTIKRTDGTTVHYTKAISSASSGGQVITGLA